MSSATPQPPSPPEDRIHALDSLRAVAMFLGIVVHGAIPYASSVPITWPALDVRRDPSFDFMIGIIHGFRMQLFFFIAGFFARLLYERLGPAGFARHRLKRIGIPFVGGLVVLLPLFASLLVWGLSRMPDPSAMPQPPGQVGSSLPTLHLWFLEYLLIFYAAVLVARPLLDRLPATFLATWDRLFDRLIQSPWRALPFVPLTVACLWNGPIWGEPESPGASVVPEPRALAHYGLFFAVGWWLHRRRSLLPELARFPMSNLAMATAALAAFGSIRLLYPGPARTDEPTLKTACLAATALYAWLMVFTVTGWFLRFAAKPSQQVRYLADASYWCYLAHIPVVIALQIVMMPWPLFSWVKFTLVITITMLVLLVVYEKRVRYHWLGTLLNGARKRPQGGAELLGRTNAS
jgi:peptidoglycan/LPS O-acetylase OafA/YrhL